MDHLEPELVDLMLDTFCLMQGYFFELSDAERESLLTTEFVPLQQRIRALLSFHRTSDDPARDAVVHFLRVYDGVIEQLVDLDDRGRAHMMDETREALESRSEQLARLCELLMMEPNPESTLDIDAFRQALQYLQNDCYRLFREQDFELPPRERTQHLVDQLLALEQELDDLSGFQYSDEGVRVPDNVRELSVHNLLEPIRWLYHLLVVARAYARSSAEPLEVNMASTRDTDLAIQVALPRIRYQCNHFFAEQGLTMTEYGRVGGRVQQLQELTREFREITGLQFNEQGAFEPAFREQNALRSIDNALHVPIFRTYRLLCNAWTFARVASQIQRRVAQAVEAMPRTTAEAIKTSNQAAGPSGAEFPSTCMICLRDWDAEDDIVQLSCHFTHVLHADCARELLSSYVVCPLCRRSIP